MRRGKLGMIDKENARWRKRAATGLRQRDSLMNEKTEEQWFLDNSLDQEELLW